MYYETMYPITFVLLMVFAILFPFLTRKFSLMSGKYLDDLDKFLFLTKFKDMSGSETLIFSFNYTVYLIIVSTMVFIVSYLWPLIWLGLIVYVLINILK